MKIKIFIVLTVFIITIFAPFKVNVNFNTASKTASILTLDICHASGAPLSAQVDVPCVLRCPCELSHFVSSLTYSAANSVFIPLLTGFRQERPPKA